MTLPAPQEKIIGKQEGFSFPPSLFPISLILITLFVSIRLYQLGHQEAKPFRLQDPIQKASSLVLGARPAVAANAQPQTQSPVSSSPQKETKKGPNKGTTPPPNTLPDDPENYVDPLNLTKEELQELTKLSSRRTSIMEKEKSIGIQVQQLEANKIALNRNIKAMEKLLTELREEITEKEKANAENMKSLVKVYESMRPEEAARIFANLAPTILLEISDAMKPRKFSAILGALPPEKAARLTEGLAQARMAMSKL